MARVCDLCGTLHEAWQAHDFSKKRVVNAPVVSSEQVDALMDEIAQLKARIRELEAERVPKPKVDRRAYMREYMRKRRAK